MKKMALGRCLNLYKRLYNSLFYNGSGFLFPLQSRSYNTRNGMDEGPAYVMKQKVIKGQMRWDPKQAPIVDNLQEVYNNIKSYSPRKLISGKPPKGLYIFGSVGVGKTTLMDIFYESVKTKSKRRSHFNDFMADVHSRIHKMKNLRPKQTVWSDRHSITDPIRPVAKQLVSEAWLLCFDEFQVTDIADAMILKSLFTQMFDYGMVMVATSNRAPDDLYKHGIQRSNFVPFIPVLKKYCKISGIAGKDYRISSKGIGDKYIIHTTRGSTQAMEEAYKQLCAEEQQPSTKKTLKVLGRNLTFQNACGRVLYVSFKEICEKPLSATDYVQIAKNFDTVLIRDIPKMTSERRNEMRRFILLIDTLYDYKVRLMLSAETEAKALFTLPNARSSIEDQERLLMDDLNLQKKSENDKFSLFSSSEEIFAFDRTVSRITEMCSSSYWDQNGK